MTYETIFGEDRQNAPPRQYVEPSTPVMVHIPSNSGPVQSISMPYELAMKLHHDLGQTLARMMRKRGSSMPPGGDTGGTPAALREAT